MDVSIDEVQAEVAPDSGATKSDDRQGRDQAGPQTTGVMARAESSARLGRRQTRMHTRLRAY